MKDKLYGISEYNVVLADDSSPCLDILKILTSSYNHPRQYFYQIPVQNGADALEAIIKNSVDGRTMIDLLITDYCMPLMDGMMLINVIRNHSNYPSLPIIIVSVSDSDELLKFVDETDNCYLLQKPVKRADLDAIIKNILPIESFENGVGDVGNSTIMQVLTNGAEIYAQYTLDGDFEGYFVEGKHTKLIPSVDLIEEFIENKYLLKSTYISMPKSNRQYYRVFYKS